MRRDMVRDPKIVQYVEELDLLIIADGDGGKLYHINGDVIAGMWKAYADGHGIDYDICEGCERVDPETAEPKHGRWIEYVNSHCECPFCHSEWSFFDNETERFDYCPNCGSKMDL